MRLTRHKISAMKKASVKVKSQKKAKKASPKMSKRTEQPTSVLKNSRHEKFAQLVAAGASASEAYRSIGGKGSKNANVHSARMMANDSILARITELKQAAAAQVEFSLIDAMNLIKEIIETPVGAVDKNHRLCQEYSETVGESSSSIRFKMPDKLSALEKLIRIKGWYAAEKQEHSISESKPIICMLPPIITTPRPTKHKGANLPPQK